MSTDPEKLLPLKAFLLGNLSSDEQEKLEQQLMSDNAVFDELERVEYELIEAYLDGDLSADEKAKMESLFLLAPERKQQLSFARTLRQFIAEIKPKPTFWEKFKQWLESWPFQSPVPAWAIATAVLLLILGGASWSVLRIAHIENALNKAVGDSHRQLNAMQKRNAELSSALEQEQNQRKELEQMAANSGSGKSTEIPTLMPGLSKAIVYPLDLSQGLLRDIGTNRKVKIPQQADFVQPLLSMPDENYPRYRASLQRVGEIEVWSEITANPLSVRIPAKVLEPADYILELKGITANGQIEDINSYYFRVVRK
jgi:hypothetical protein